MIFRKDDQFSFAYCNHRSGAGEAVNQSHLPEVIPGMEEGDHLLPGTLPLSDLKTPRLDDIHRIPLLPFSDDHLPLLNLPGFEDLVELGEIKRRKPAKYKDLS